MRSINVSGHKFGLVYPGIGWLIFREKSDLAEELVFYENYLGKTDATFTLNFSTGSAMVLAQYYNFVRLGREGYGYVMKAMQQNARAFAAKLKEIGTFELIGDEEEQLPLVAFKLAEKHAYDEFDVSWQLSAERGWMLPAYTMPPDAQEVKVLRALVKETLGRSLIDHLAADVEGAVADAGEEGRRPRVRAPQDDADPRLLRLAEPRRRAPRRSMDRRGDLGRVASEHALDRDQDRGRRLEADPLAYRLGDRALARREGPRADPREPQRRGAGRVLVADQEVEGPARQPRRSRPHADEGDRRQGDPRNLIEMMRA